MSSIDILFSSSVINRTSQACIVDVTPPTFAGITSLVANANGSLTASWSAASDVTLPIRYQVYVQANSSTGLFNNSNFQGCARDGNLNHTFFTDASDNSLTMGTTYFVGVRAIDGVGNLNTNLAVLSAVSNGVADNSLSNKIDVLLARLTSGRALNLDNLDATISSRATQTSVNNIQNNTSFVGVVPSPMILPASGSKNYKIYAIINNEHGSPEDPDSNTINYRIEDTAGSVIVSTTAMIRTGVGQYETTYTVNSSDTERALVVIFEYVENSVSFKQIRTTEVQEFESKLDTLISRLTPTRASNLDNLDVTVSSRSSEANAITRFNTHETSIAGVQTTANTINTKIGTPVSSVSADIAAVKSVDDTINSKIGTPVATVSTDIAAVKTVVDATRTDYTTVRAAKIDNLDVLLSSRASEANSITRFNTLNSNDATILSAVNSIQNNTSFVGVVPTFEIPPSGSQSYKIYANLFDNAGAPNDPDGNVMNYRIEDTNGGIIVPTTAMTRDGIGKYSVNYVVLSTDIARPIVVFFEYNEATVAFQQTRLSSVGSSQTNLDILVDRLTEQRAENLDNLDATVSSRSKDVDVTTLLSRLTSQRALNLDNLDATVSSRASTEDIDNGIERTTTIELVGYIEEDDELVGVLDDV